MQKIAPVVYTVLVDNQSASGQERVWPESSVSQSGRLETAAWLPGSEGGRRGLR